MLITVVFKAPKMRDLNFHDELMTHLKEIGNHSNANHVFSGDFNQGFNKKSAITTDLIEVLSNLGLNLILTPNQITRTKTLTKSTIDIAFADINCESNAIKTTITDYCGIIVRTNKNLKNDTNSNRVKYIGRNWSTLKQHKIQSLLNCNLSIKLREEKHILKQFSTQEPSVKLRK